MLVCSILSDELGGDYVVIAICFILRHEVQGQPELLEERMKIDWFTRMLLTVIAVALTVLAFRPIFSPVPASAQSGAYGYLAPQVGNTANGGTEFIDMRNGNDYACTYTECKLYGQFAFAQIK